MDMQIIGVIYQERLKTGVKLLFSANRKSYMPCRLAQQRMTLSDLEWPFRASRAISAGLFCTTQPTGWKRYSKRLTY